MDLTCLTDITTKVKDPIQAAKYLIFFTLKIKNSTHIKTVFTFTAYDRILWDGQSVSRHVVIDVFKVFGRSFQVDIVFHCNTSWVCVDFIQLFLPRLKCQQFG